MSIARGIAKAAKAQSRGLSGKRNSQGDFMPEDVQVKGIQESVDVDIQKYIDDVKSQIDEIDAQIDDIRDLDTDIDTPGMSLDDWDAELQRLGNEKEVLINDLITKLEENGIEVPSEILALHSDPFSSGVSPRDTAKKAWSDRNDTTAEDRGQLRDPLGGL